MDARSWRRLIKNYVLPKVPELVLSGSILHLPDPEWLLCAAIENNSAFSKSFTVDVIVMPLYRPTDHLGWLVGERLGSLTGGHDVWWQPATQSAEVIAADIAERLRAGAMPFWRRLGLLDAFATECQGRRTFAIDPHYVEWVAGAGVITGADSVAKVAFDATARLQPRQAWERDAQQRVLQLAATWASDRSKALATLARYRDQTAEAIGLR